MSSSLPRSEIKIEEVCRTCLSKDTELHSVFEDCLGAETLLSVFTTVTGLKFEAGDGLPSGVCGDCKEKALIAYDFKSCSLEADKVLRGLIKVKNENVAKKEPEGTVEVKTEEDLPADSTDDFLDLEIEPYPETGNNNEGNSTYCPVCGESYDDAAGLTRHMWQSHPNLMGPKKRGRPKQLLTSAILKKLEESGHQALIKRHSCAFCRAEATSREDLAMHMMQHKDEKLLRCLQCKLIYLTKENMEGHTCENRTNTSQEQQDERFVAEIPLQDFLSSNKREFEGILHVCANCGSVFLSAKELSSHRDADHPELSLRCSYCHKVFASLRGAARHRDSCALVERSFVCGSCGSKFQHEITLNKHILRYHVGHPVSVRFNTGNGNANDTGNGNDNGNGNSNVNANGNDGATEFRCDICSRTFSRKEQLLKHVKVHQKSEDKCFECDICNKKFHRRNNLRSHMRIHQPRQPSSCKQLCLYCGRGFSNSSNLIVHMRRHTGEKPYKCDFCGKGFPRSSDLQCHRRSHTGEKPCICGVCGKGFSRSNKLSRHMRVHTGVKPYKCSYCDKAFSQSNDLTLHVRRHTGDKPYVCELCGDRFIQGTALHNHRRVHGHYPPAMISGHSQTVAMASANESLPFATLTLAD